MARAETWACEAPDHEGSRTDIHPADRFTRRRLFMRADGKQRLHEESLDRLCRYCIRKERENIEQLQLGIV